MKSRLITVFGASGFIGGHVVKRLARQGHLVRAAVRNPSSALFLKTMGEVGQITPVQANIRNQDMVANAVDGADGVINLVGIFKQVGRQRFNDVHCEGAKNVALASANLELSVWCIYLHSVLHRVPRHLMQKVKQRERKLLRNFSRKQLL